MKEAFIVGTRPSYIQLKAYLEIEHIDLRDVILINTGQHYDPNMAGDIIQQLGLKFDHSLGCKSQGDWMSVTPGLQALLEEHKVELAYVFGDTDSAYYAAFAIQTCGHGRSRGPKLVHVEAGLRCKRDIPEEENRIMIDRIADARICPTDYALANLWDEGLMTGNTIGHNYKLEYFNLVKHRAIPVLSVSLDGYHLLTLHRQENVNDAKILEQLINSFTDSKLRVVFPCHPRTRKNLPEKIPQQIQLMDPQDYFHFLGLLQGAQKVFTDSGGVQLEANEIDKPTFVLREVTEWTHTLAENVRLVGRDGDKICSEVE